MSLRAPRDTDAYAIAAGCSDAEVARWTRVPSPYTLEDARAWLALVEVQGRKGEELALVITRAGAEQVVGGVSLRMRDGEDPHGDIGYWVAAAARRQGLGVRAVRLVASYGLDQLGLSWIEIAVSPRNEPSQRLARRAGFEHFDTQLREFRGRMEEFDLFRLARQLDAPSEG